MKQKIIKSLKFFGLSGIGWLMDVSIYSILSYIFNINVGIANIISSFVAVTFVFTTSTRKIFKNTQSFKLRYKYIAYLIYQVLLITLSSFVIAFLKDFIVGLSISWLNNYVNILVKIIVTPFTMVLNYIVMSLLIEKI